MGNIYTNIWTETFEQLTVVPAVQEKTFLHICAFHMMCLNRQHATKNCGTGEEGKGSVHFVTCCLED